MLLTILQVSGCPCRSAVEHHRVVLPRLSFENDLAGTLDELGAGSRSDSVCSFQRVPRRSEGPLEENMGY